MRDPFEEINRYPKYQYSKFDSENGQIVVRTEIKEEFEELVEYAKNSCKVKVINPNPPTPIQERNVSADEFEKGHICPTHGVAMVEKTSKTKVDDDGNPIKYWSHSKQEGDKWMMCFGRGFKSK